MIIEYQYSLTDFGRLFGFTWPNLSTPQGASAIFKHMRVSYSDEFEVPVGRSTGWSRQWNDDSPLPSLRAVVTLRQDGVAISSQRLWRKFSFLSKVIAMLTDASRGAVAI